MEIKDKNDNTKVIYKYDDQNRLIKKIKLYINYNGDCYQNIFIYEYNKQNQKILKTYKELIKPNRGMFRFLKKQKHIKCNMSHEYYYDNKKQKKIKIFHCGKKNSLFKYEYNTV
ncbi:MAG: hypothetical protein Q8764_02715 [Pigeon pea little leaf phytoplasma]|uniref:DUF2963 domain-containing protein n=1 Tax=Candidatus Phytoplasma fabacearum TaxID=2982628 RepID=A0ABU8ZT90_9MOLU|nr:hypothetical protein ['Bituminaria bituminosa' little leaf phytoplasma]MDV3149054.1 hypothetical protein [Pigeon pea little leaf phytoplasma]MDV3197814.1 hypothetical protein [Candidatus Phytoplasma australasiaticum]MDO7983845.1 hypothetical protein ['Bituminaria bituminosa' little leaf phytoplasma]MDO8024162.1 hypothetical protein ['Bituminaria bituminosa' little leaf phytoplasma]MDO8030853.1 hypothetical protein ['Bituminaria bituminosa' little leaf phytoplasma]